MFLVLYFDSLALRTVCDLLLDVFGDSGYEVFAFENGDGFSNSPMSLENSVMVCVDHFWYSCLRYKDAVSDLYALVGGFVFGIESVVTICVRGNAVFEIPRISCVVWDPVV